MDYNNNAHGSSQITFGEVLGMFRGKLKMVLLITLVVAIIGGALGAFFNLSTKTYEATIKFYLTTQDGSQALLPLLSSDSFAEKLILEENGLPKREDCNPEDYDAALAAITAYNNAVDTKREAVKQSIINSSAFTVIESKYNSALDEYNRRFEELSIYLGAQDKVASSENYEETIALYENRLEEARTALYAVKKDYDEAKNKKTESLDAIVIAKEAVKETRYNAQEAAEKVLAPWREKEDVKDLIDTITASVTYEYAKYIDDKEAEKTLADTAQNQNAAFLIINVSLDDDKETAEFIVERLKSRLPAFVEDNIERLTDVNEARCTLISTFEDVAEAEPQSLVKTIIKYAVLPAILSFVVICVVIIFKGCLPAEATEKKTKKVKKDESQA